MASVATKKANKHRKIICQYLLQYAQSRNEALGNALTYQAILDTKSHHYLLVRLGWVDGRYAYLLLFHLDIAPETGKVWLQQNNTETLIAQELTQLGILPSDIVLGFQPAELRVHTAYAVS